MEQPYDESSPRQATLSSISGCLSTIKLIEIEKLIALQVSVAKGTKDKTKLYYSKSY